MIPVRLAQGEVPAAIRAGKLDAIAWSGITETYAVGWANLTGHFLTDGISGAWCGSYFANQDSWTALPVHLKRLFEVCMNSSHYNRRIF